MSHVTKCEWVTAHKCVPSKYAQTPIDWQWVTSHMWMSHVTTFEWVTSHIWMSHVTKCEWVTSHMWMSHVAKCEWVTSHKCVPSKYAHTPVDYEWGVSNVNESCHTYEWLWMRLIHSHSWSMCTVLCSSSSISTGILSLLYGSFAKEPYKRDYISTGLSCQACHSSLCSLCDTPHVNIVSFIGLFCKRDLWLNHMTHVNESWIVSLL